MTISHLGETPLSWKGYYSVPASFSLLEWIQNLSMRLDHLSRRTLEKSVDVWLGGLFNPHGFITATRQATARTLSLPLESLQLALTSSKPQGNDTSFVMSGKGPLCSTISQPGLKIQGAAWENDTLVPGKESNAIPFSDAILSWSISPSGTTSDSLQIPVYLNQDRQDILFSITLNINCNRDLLIRQGAALLAD